MLAARERLKFRQSAAERRSTGGINRLSGLISNARKVGQVGLQTYCGFAIDGIGGELFALQLDAEPDEFLVDAQDERNSAFASWRGWQRGVRLTGRCDLLLRCSGKRGSSFVGCNDCFDAEPRPNAPEGLLAFLPAGTVMRRIDTEEQP